MWRRRKRGGARCGRAGGAGRRAWGARWGCTRGGMVKQVKSVPEGPAWIGPEAEAGRADLAPPRELEAEPRALAEAAASGHVEAALRTYRRVAAALPEGEDRELRSAL